MRWSWRAAALVLGQFLGSSCSSGQTPSAKIACVSVPVPPATPVPTPSLPAGRYSSTTVYFDFAVKPDGRMFGLGEQSDELRAAVASYVRSIGEEWQDDCSTIGWQYSSSERTGWCSIVSQTESDRAHRRVRAILLPPPTRGEGGYRVFDASLLVRFEQQGHGWVPIEQKRAFSP